MERTPSSLNKLFFDMKLGSISLKNLYYLALNLEVDVKELFEKANIEQEVEDSMWRKRIFAATSAMPNGAQVELKQILAPFWSSLSYSKRKLLGKKFYWDVLDRVYPNIHFLKKKSDNHALYEISCDDDEE